MDERTFRFAARDAMHVDECVINGVDVRNAVRGLTYRYETGYVPTLTLDLPIVDATEMGSDGVKVVMPAATRDLLIAAGWTPPEGDRG